MAEAGRAEASGGGGARRAEEAEARRAYDDDHVARAEALEERRGGPEGARHGFEEEHRVGPREARWRALRVGRFDVEVDGGA